MITLFFCFCFCFHFFVLYLKVTTFIIFRCTIQQHWVHSHCCAAKTTIHLQNGSSSLTETLYPLNHYFLLLPSTPVNPYSTFCIYKFDYSHVSGIIQYLSFHVWFISLSIMLSGLIHVVVNWVLKKDSFWHTKSSSQNWPQASAGFKTKESCPCLRDCRFLATNFQM